MLGVTAVVAAGIGLAVSRPGSDGEPRSLAAGGAVLTWTERIGSVEVTVEVRPRRPRVGQTVRLSATARDASGADQFIRSIGFGDAPFGVPGCPAAASGRSSEAERSVEALGGTFSADHTYDAPGRYMVTVVVVSCPSGRSLTLKRPFPVEPAR